MRSVYLSCKVAISDISIVSERYRLPDTTHLMTIQRFLSVAAIPDIAETGGRVNGTDLTYMAAATCSVRDSAYSHPMSQAAEVPGAKTESMPMVTDRTKARPSRWYCITIFL